MHVDHPLRERVEELGRVDTVVAGQDDEPDAVPLEDVDEGQVARG